jgi:hypothetical protein
MPLKLDPSAIGCQSYDAHIATGSEIRTHARPIPKNQILKLLTIHGNPLCDQQHFFLKAASQWQMRRKIP